MFSLFVSLDEWMIGQVKVAGTPARYYYLKDHLGSIKMTVDASGTVNSYDDYYPFGMQMPNRSQVSSADGRFKFTGKERDLVETGYDYFGARYYDSRFGRWLQVDPLADKFAGWSVYNYGLDNPLKFVDPNGMEAAPPEPANIEPSAEQKRRMEEKRKEFKENKKEFDEAWENGSIWDKVTSTFNVLIDGVEKGYEEFSIAPTPSAIVITPSLITNVVNTAGKAYNSQISFGARALSKKIGHALAENTKSAFDGIKPTTENAQKIIRDILNNPVTISSGKIHSDVYNSIGQGLRINNRTQAFETFLEISKRTR